MKPATYTSPMIHIPGQTLKVGSSEWYPEESPPRWVTVQPFALDVHPVTNAQFARFVYETGYVTEAEVEGQGGHLFTPTEGPVSLDDWRAWWELDRSASWRHPKGRSADLYAPEDLADHPVVLVSFRDCDAYAQWAGRRLPTEVELECAASSGDPDSTYAWGDEERPGGQILANTWQGRFPYTNNGALGWVGTSPVGTFPANRWGLVDVIGNVWEWTSTLYTTGPLRNTADNIADSGASTADDNLATSSCCTPRIERAIAAASLPGSEFSRRVIKGGSHLCSREYCHRFRPSARQGITEDSATSHVGFRCAR